MSNSSIDVFQNPSNDYIYPSLSPCPNVADDQILTWTKNGLTIIKGSQEIANADFSDLSIPINSYNQQQKLLQPGEVTFIQGLTKELCYRTQGFNLPSLDSSDLALNQYFMQIDLSLSYYTNFSYTSINVEASANYGENIDIASALNLEFNDKSIKIMNIYDPSILTFTGTQEGYNFTISNVYLTIIDTSIDASSCFNNGKNAEIYDLLENPSTNIPYAKYSNTAMQGIILRAIYPDENDEDKWIYLNHTSDYVTIFSSIDVSYDSDVSSNLVIIFEPSTFISPVVVYDPSLEDVSIYDDLINNTIAENCYFEDCSILNSIIGISDFVNCNIIDSSIVNNCDLKDDSSISNCIIINDWVNAYKLLVYQDPCTGAKTYEYTLDYCGYDKVNIYESTIWDSSLNNCLISDSSIYNSYIKDSSIIGCTLYNTLYDTSTTLVNCINYFVDSSIGCQYQIISDTSTYYKKQLKRLDVGLSGTSTDEVMSAGDYLNWITLNDEWKKIGEMYIWVSPVESSDSIIKNLISGFYVFNPHDFTIKIEYLIFV